MDNPFGPTARERQFEETLRDGVSAAKAGERLLAQRLLTRATMINPGDARAYLWLSATTDDPKEQIEYLEEAVARDPTNVAARRGLAMLKGKIDPTQMMPQGAALKESRNSGEIEAQTETFDCPKCGGRMSFSVQIGLLKCDYCGYVKIEEQETAAPKAAGPLADRAEQVLEFVVPTTRGHRWAESQESISCERCGAVALLPPGQSATQCAYCGSNQLVKSPELGELIDPQVIAVMKFDEQEAMKQVKEWLRRGLLAPDDLQVAVRGLRLRPAYYSCWTFDGTLEVKWTAEVAEGSGQYKHWISTHGAHTQFFNDVVVPGARALTLKELESISPFDLVNIEEFKPEYLAGWPAMIYNRSLSDASLLAREKVFKELRPQLPSMVQMGREMRNFQTGGSAWIGMTYKHILLPTWIGTYLYRGKEYHLLVNGQTGKVGGYKPRDRVKLIFALLMAIGFFALLALVYWLLNSAGA